MNGIMAHDGFFYYTIQGLAEGTSYNIIYKDEQHRDFQSEIDNLLAGFEKSLSVYDKDSIISRINRNEIVKIDHYFHTVFTRAKEISKQTEGAFGISAEPLFRAWGFSSVEKSVPTDQQIAELKKNIGMDKIRIENGFVVKDNLDIVLNANAIAKGYSADIIADFLQDKGCRNYLVEIGGEIRVKGVNPEGELWRIGVDRPSESNLIPGQDLQLILHITDRGIATSGNYRQYYMEKGQKITHTIDPVSGYPAQHNLLSTTVVAQDALTADAFATAFMVGGMEKAAGWIEKYQYLDAVFICDEDGEYKVYCTSGLEDKISGE